MKLTTIHPLAIPLVPVEVKTANRNDRVLSNWNRKVWLMNRGKL